MGTNDSTEQPRRRAATLAPAIALVSLLAVGVIADVRFAPPAVRPQSAPATEFSAERARAHLDVIASAPRPVGSAHNQRTRAYLIETAQALGFSVEVQSEPVVRESWGNPFPAGTLHNVSARLPGTEGARAVLIMGHYDSVPTGPGAADNGAAVAAMLETMRALRAGEPLRNDVVFLFTDAEEAGGLGAEAFRELSWSERWGVLLNFEARGNRGPTLMFETTDGNGELIRAFAAASVRPFGHSLSYEIYRHLPLDTDFTVFKKVGANGMNFAFLHGFRDYHTVDDRPERLDPGSLQHHGESMLALARHFGRSDISALRADNLVFFDVMGAFVVRYPMAAALPLAIASGILVLALAGWAMRRGLGRGLRIAGVAGTMMGMAVLAAAAAFGLYLLASSVQPEMKALPLGEPYARPWYLVGFVALLLAFVAATGWLVSAFGSQVEVLAGVLVALSVLLVTSALTVPGATYLLQWPVLAGAVALGRAVKRNGALTGWVDHALLWVAPAIAAALFVPLIDSLFAVLGLQLAAVPSLLSMLAATLALPLVLRRRALGYTATAALVIAVVTVVATAALSDFDRQNPRQNTLVYVQDDELGQAWWVSSDPAPDEWTAQALGETPEKAPVDKYFPVLREPMWRAAAENLHLPAPGVETLEDRVQDGVRTLRVRVTPAREAPLLQLQALPRVPLRAVAVAGERLDAATLARQGEGADGVVFHYWAVPPSGLELVFELPAGERLPLRVTTISYGLPEAAQARLRARPTDATMAAFGWALNDAAVVSTTLTL